MRCLSRSASWVLLLACGLVAVPVLRAAPPGAGGVDASKAGAAGVRKSMSLSVEDLLFIPLGGARLDEAVGTRKAQVSLDEAKARLLAGVRLLLPDDGAAKIEVGPQGRFDLVVDSTVEGCDRVVKWVEDRRADRGTQVVVVCRFISMDDAALRSMPMEVREQAATVFAMPARQTLISAEDAGRWFAAVQATNSATIVQAPRMTLFEHARAGMKVGANRSYVVDHRLTPASGPGASAGLEPVTASVFSGVELSVRGSAGRDAAGKGGGSVAVEIEARRSEVAKVDTLPWPGGPRDGKEIKVERPKVDIGRWEGTASLGAGESLLAVLDSPVLGGQTFVLVTAESAVKGGELGPVKASEK